MDSIRAPMLQRRTSVICMNNRKFDIRKRMNELLLQVEELKNQLQDVYDDDN